MPNVTIVFAAIGVVRCAIIISGLLCMLSAWVVEWKERIDVYKSARELEEEITALRLEVALLKETVAAREAEIEVLKMDPRPFRGPQASSAPV